MKDTHLIIALYRALDRYGSSERPRDDDVPDRRDPPGPPERSRRRRPGWVTIGEIEASQSPNTYPRLTRRSIRLRCETLLNEDGSPVIDVERSAGGLRTWVLVAPPGGAAGDVGQAPRDAAEDHERRDGAGPEGTAAAADEGTGAAARDDDPLPRG